MINYLLPRNRGPADTWSSGQDGFAGTAREADAPRVPLLRYQLELLSPRFEQKQC